MTLPNPGESFSDWQDRKRIAEEHWRRANESLSPPVKPQIPEVIRYRPGPGIVLGREEPREPLAEGNLSFLNLFIAVPGVFAWPLLYPVPVAVAFVSAGLLYGVMEYVFGVESGPGRVLVTAMAGLVGLVLLIAASRVDHRFARSRPWQALRHIVRLGLFATAAHLVITYRTTGTLRPDATLLQQPLHLGSVGAILLLTHWILTRESLRAKWHAGLEAIGLRPNTRLGT